MDDVLRLVLDQIKRSKIETSSSAGKAKEINGCLIELSNPIARLSRTESRSVIFSCLGETLWYFSNSSELAQIEYYIPSYREKARIHQSYSNAPGAYGPRLFGGRSGVNQIARIISDLSTTQKHDSRQAVVQVFSKLDIGTPDVPCTCVIQFLARKDQLNVVTYMRSNDAWVGLPHDIFAYTWLQEVVARSINHRVGTYKHMVGSLHVYQDDLSKIEEFIDEGYQDQLPMPDMPLGNPWQSIKWLLKNEKHIREGARNLLPIKNEDPYWQDLARILLIGAFGQDGDLRNIVNQKRLMKSKTYESFIRRKEITVARTNSQPPIPGIIGQRQGNEL